MILKNFVVSESNFRFIAKLSGKYRVPTYPLPLQMHNFPYHHIKICRVFFL